MMTFIRVISIALVLASTTAWRSHPPKLEQNQYQAAEDSPQSLQLLDEATVHNSKPVEDSTPAPDLQVGCGEGHIHEHSEPGRHLTLLDKLQEVAEARPKRSIYYYQRVPRQGMRFYRTPYQSVRVWREPYTQLKRPYYIPAYGAVGQTPIYFPPQPLFPMHVNRKPVYTGPGYLPPQGPGGEKVNITTRFDDRPTWSVDNEVTTTAIIPTRRTRRPGAPVTFPPLIHGVESEIVKESPALETVPIQPPQSRPPKENPSQNRPSNRPGKDTPSTQPSRCVWAIISCCSTAGEISYECFEQRGCPGAFWDNNPCNGEFAKAAIASALNFYGSK